MIAFRVDANEKIATGHLMRCMAIAAECRKRDRECIFIMAEEREARRLKERGFAYHILDSAWNDLEAELPLLSSFLVEKGCDCLVVDSYQATPYYLKTLQDILPVLYLDDVGAETYEVSAILRYGLYSDGEAFTERYRGSLVSLYTGTEYIPLREEFQDSNTGERERTSGRTVLEILVTTGGTDPYHVTWRLLNWILASAGELQGCRYHVIMGSMNEDKENLRGLVEETACLPDGQPQILLYDYVSRMADLMCRCDLAVSAGGTTLYELCACGTPTVCFSFADNQLEGVQELERRKIMEYAGDARTEDVVPVITRKLQNILCDPEAQSRYAEQMKALVDGKGIQRIADIIDNIKK